jgi:hypothetical protein
MKAGSARPASPGDYELRVEAVGFSPLVRHIHLEVTKSALVELTLKIGPANETVEVEGGPPLVDAESSTLSNERAGSAIRNLPLNGRNFTELMGLTAGVVNTHTQLTGLLPLAAARGEASYSVNGLRAEENQFLIDGISDNENHVGLGVVMYPPIDAVQEFRMETSAATHDTDMAAAVIREVALAATIITMRVEAADRISIHRLLTTLFGGANAGNGYVSISLVPEPGSVISLVLVKVWLVSDLVCGDGSFRSAIAEYEALI